MAKKLKKQDKKRVGVSLERLISGVVRGLGGLLGLAADLERQGKSEYAEKGEISGKTKSGKEYKGAYGFRVKVGLHPEEFRGQKKLPSHGSRK